MNVKYSDLSEAAGQPDGLAVLGIIFEHDRETRQTDDFFRVTLLKFPVKAVKKIAISDFPPQKLNFRALEILGSKNKTDFGTTNLADVLSMVSGNAEKKPWETGVRHFFSPQVDIQSYYTYLGSLTTPSCNVRP